MGVNSRKTVSDIIEDAFMVIIDFSPPRICNGPVVLNNLKGLGERNF